MKNCWFGINRSTSETNFHVNAVWLITELSTIISYNINSINRKRCYIMLNVFECANHLITLFNLKQNKKSLSAYQAIILFIYKYDIFVNIYLKIFGNQNLTGERCNDVCFLFIYFQWKNILEFIFTKRLLICTWFFCNPMK